MANERPSSALLNCHASMSIQVPDGPQGRKMVNLELARSTSVVMRGSWNLTHKLDTNSPLHGLTRENAEQKMFGLLVFVSGTDEKYMQTVYVHKVLYCKDLRFDSVFENMYDMSDPTKIVINVGALHSVRTIEQNEKKQ